MNAFDFGRLAGSGGIDQITDPVQLFDALPDKAPGYGYLRAVQKTVLDAWSARRNDRDLVIKTNTGGGKTIVGLLSLQCCLHEGKGPALYVAPDPHLADRVRREAHSLGLAVTDDPRDERFLGGEAVCVTTMKTLVNAKTRFGLAGAPGRSSVPVVSVVVDDAHSALGTTEQDTRLSIPAGHEAYGKLVDLFADDLSAQSPNTFADIQDGTGRAVLRVPFWSWRDKHVKVLEILRPHRAHRDLEWAWPFVCEILPICQAVVSGTGFEIVPPCPPIEKIPSFADAKRRIYLTATLADDSILITHFDADPDSVSTSIVPDSAADLGDRLVLAPQVLNPDLSRPQVQAMAVDVARTRNVVVLVPSWARAREWEAQAELTASKAEDISAAVDRLAREHVGLVVIVNRYDGIDLPDEACRLLVLDGLPFALGCAELRESAALRDSQAMVTRQLQRLEQGMGRGVRSRDDRCVVLLLDERLTLLVARADVADRMSSATQAQLKLSRQVAASLNRPDAETLLGVMQQVINGDAAFRRLSREALLGTTYATARVSPHAHHLRKAYNAAAAGMDADAAQHARAAVEAARGTGDTRLAGWIGETHAAYLHAVDPVGAQRVLKQARKDNTGVLRPKDAIVYEPISDAPGQAKTCAAYLTGRYAAGEELVQGFGALMADIAWDNDRTDDAEAALRDLGLHLGFAAHRPEAEFGLGSDVLWVLDNKTFAVIEAKTGATAPTIWKKDANQLAGSANWCTQEYPGAKVVPVMVHQHAVVDHTATPPPGTRVVTVKKLTALNTAVRAFALALSIDDNYRNPDAVAARLVEFDLSAEKVFATFAETAVREPRRI